MPIALSQGIPLLPAGERSPRLRLLESKVLPSGIVTLNYAIQYDDSPKKPKKAKRSPNKTDAPNPAIAPRFQVRRQWRGVGDPDRSACSQACHSGT